MIFAFMFLCLISAVCAVVPLLLLLFSLALPKTFCKTFPNTTRKNIIRVILFSTLMFLVLYIYTEYVAMAQVSHIKQERFSAITDVVYISNDGSACLYLTQKIRKTYNDVLPPTLFMANGNGNVRKRFVFDDLIQDIAVVGESFFYTDGRNINSCNYNTEKYSHIFKLDEEYGYICSLDITYDKKFLVFTTANEVEARDEYRVSWRSELNYDTTSSTSSPRNSDTATGELYLYNMETKELEEIGFDGGYEKYPQFPSISNNNIVVFSLDDSIFSYDIKTKKTVRLATGQWPQMAKNSDIIMFKERREGYKNNVSDVFTYDLSDKDRNIINLPKENDNMSISYGSAFQMNATYASKYFDISADGNVVAFFAQEYEITDRSTTLMGKKVVVLDRTSGDTVTIPRVRGLRTIDQFDVQNSLALSNNGKYLAYSGYGFLKDNKNIPEVYIMNIKTKKMTKVNTPYKNPFTKTVTEKGRY